MFQEINFALQNFCCQDLNMKGKTLLVVVNKLFVFSSKAKHDFFSFLSGLCTEWAQKFKFFQIAVEESDSMKRNYASLLIIKVHIFWEDHKILSVCTVDKSKVEFLKILWPSQNRRTLPKLLSLTKVHISEIYSRNTRI